MDLKSIDFYNDSFWRVCYACDKRGIGRLRQSVQSSSLEIQSLPSFSAMIFSSQRRKCLFSLGYVLLSSFAIFEVGLQS